MSSSGIFEENNNDTVPFSRHEQQATSNHSSQLVEQHSENYEISCNSLTVVLLTTAESIRKVSAALNKSSVHVVEPTYALPMSSDPTEDLHASDHTDVDVLQCSPTKKGHPSHSVHLCLWLGYSCSLQWFCFYWKKTVSEEELPEWVSIYYVKVNDTDYRCNLCEITIVPTSKNNSELLDHIKDTHKEIFDLHKENPEATVGFRIEFLQLNVQNDGEAKNQPIILGEVCEATTEEVIQSTPFKEMEVEKSGQQEVIVMTKTKKVKKELGEKGENRKRSWVWKYFHQMSNIIFQCTLCNVVLSIKGCNTNNMNRHIRARHPSIYRCEAMQKKNMSSIDQLETDFTEVETPVAIKTEEIHAIEKDTDDFFETSTQRQRRSWIWLYFNRTSSTSAQCRLCKRNICHGGNATGNMNRHLKMIHHKTGDDHHWIWKVFDGNCDDDFFSCKICNYRCTKFNDVDRSITCILEHLKVEHGVISGDQIITGSDALEEEEMN